MASGAAAESVVLVITDCPNEQLNAFYDHFYALPGIQRERDRLGVEYIGVRQEYAPNPSYIATAIQDIIRKPRIRLKGIALVAHAPFDAFARYWITEVLACLPKVNPPTVMLFAFGNPVLDAGGQGPSPLLLDSPPTKGFYFRPVDARDRKYEQWFQLITDQGSSAGFNSGQPQTRAYHTGDQIFAENEPTQDLQSIEYIVSNRVEHYYNCEQLFWEPQASQSSISPFHSSVERLSDDLAKCSLIAFNNNASAFFADGFKETPRPQEILKWWRSDDSLYQGLEASGVSPVGGVWNSSDVNILVMGETGVGKSTLINALANYITFPSLRDACKANEPVTLIPASYVLCDPVTYQETTIKTKNISVPLASKDMQARLQRNEYQVPGQSTTQDPQAYAFQVPSQSGALSTIRVIDTPGMGDSRGIETDKQNMSNIVKYVSKVGMIHSVVIALPTNQSKLTVWFRFCIMELFKYLDRDVIQNIVFLFTKARTTSFRAGDTIPVLNELFREIQSQTGISIPLTDKNTFLIDNEAYRYLLAKDTIIYDLEDIKKFNESWNRSASECRRLISLAQGQPPQDFSKTAQLEVVRDFLNTQVDPILNYDDQIVRATRERDRLATIINDIHRDIDELKKLKSVYISLVPVYHRNGVKVCSHPDCVEVKITKTGYQDLRRSVDNRSRGYHNPQAQRTCVHGAGYQKMVNVTYTIEMQQGEESSEIASHIAQLERTIDQTTRDIDSQNAIGRSVEDQKAKHLNLIALCSAFLRDNSIVLRNETLLDATDFQIIKQEAFKNGVPNQERLRNLERLKHDYDNEKRLLSQAGAATHRVHDINEIRNLMEQLEGPRGPFLSRFDRVAGERLGDREEVRLLQNPSAQPWLQFAISKSRLSPDA
ncbi:uncharacterized protein BJ171DRAFT_566188 [Polychytrium aggregatum]|uniref:uncharacterized protein n=1 Tax=Polychytrium aggregatum TaxID=110093 RepID=UPI0022FDC5A4|nr:uncharacterized protein BJ171DRAFT_566188 [Polychytrium aggregatum]KAI9207411.1 hypothetical protein BJ171DRAFT_566188 [Polychytrium aggregatum]